MSFTGDRLIDFEESNWDWLIDEFLKTKVVSELWADFVYNEYIKEEAEPPDHYGEDR